MTLRISMVTANVPYAREKLLHAIIFFTKNTQKCFKLKLFKLLFFLDFGVYRETGKSVTGLQYFAWPMGPVPTELFEELSRPRNDFQKALSVRAVTKDDPDSLGGMVILTPKVPFDQSYFTKRELAMMEQLAEIIREVPGRTMTDVSHSAGQAWQQVYEVEQSPQGHIRYKLALDGKPGSISEEEAAQIEDEGREISALLNG